MTDPLLLALLLALLLLRPCVRWATEQELSDARDSFTSALRKAMDSGQSKRLAVGKWDRSELSAVHVQEALSA